MHRTFFRWGAPGHPGRLLLFLLLLAVAAAAVVALVMILRDRSAKSAVPGAARPRRRRRARRPRASSTSATPAARSTTRSTSVVARCCARRPSHSDTRGAGVARVTAPRAPGDGLTRTTHPYHRLVVEVTRERFESFVAEAHRLDPRRVRRSGGERRLPRRG